ncbi:hypothetical protein L2E82_25128 [Cichorium intybus]|uniref:Uncharacterized protein n=1 Tax=Cichorium intybus TaxID=13427 RepID=A0ACB9E264_CICIN|nr:hypothetical protein L2E82_25128 [Cichorium intybus]
MDRNTLLPEMKLGWDRNTGVNRFLQSWKTNTIPGTGDYTFKMDIDGFLEVVLSRKGTEAYRSGPWNGRRFSGEPEMKSTAVINFELTYSSGDPKARIPLGYSGGGAAPNGAPMVVQLQMAW